MLIFYRKSLEKDAEKFIEKIKEISNSKKLIKTGFFFWVFSKCFPKKKFFTFFC